MSNKTNTLTAASLSEQNCFIGAPVKKEITWHNGDAENTAIVYVKPLSYHEAMGDLNAFHAKESAEKATAKRIAASIVDAEGKPVFTAGDIDGTANPERGAICASLTGALLNVIGEVNELGKR